MPTKPKFRERLAWAIVWNDDGEIQSGNYGYGSLEVYSTKKKANLIKQGMWPDNYRTQRVRIVKEGR